MEMQHAQAVIFGGTKNRLLDHKGGILRYNYYYECVGEAPLIGGRGLIMSLNGVMVLHFWPALTCTFFGYFFSIL